MIACDVVRVLRLCSACGCWRTPYDWQPGTVPVCDDCVMADFAEWG